jgi:hypothetical protein
MRGIKVLAVVGLAVALASWLSVPIPAQVSVEWIKIDMNGKELGSIAGESLVNPGTRVKMKVKGLKPNERVTIEVWEEDCSDCFVAGLLDPDDFLSSHQAEADGNGVAEVILAGLPSQNESQNEIYFKVKEKGVKSATILVPRQHLIAAEAVAAVKSGVTAGKKDIGVSSSESQVVETHIFKSGAIDPEVVLSLRILERPQDWEVALEKDRLSLGSRDSAPIRLKVKAPSEGFVRFQIVATVGGYTFDTDPVAIVAIRGLPALAQWGLIALGLLLAGSLAFMIRRRFAPRPAGA